VVPINTCCDYLRDLDMKVLNLYGGPGTGKSTTAAGVFHLLKLCGYESELVTEYAKYLVWSGRTSMLDEPGYVFAKQNHSLQILKDKVDVCVTDSPLPLAALYAYYGDYAQLDTFRPYVSDTFDTYSNINILLERVKPYNPVGRMQTEEEALAIDADMKALLTNRYGGFYTVKADKFAPETILDIYRSYVDA